MIRTRPPRAARRDAGQFVNRGRDGFRSAELRPHPAIVAAEHRVTALHGLRRHAEDCSFCTHRRHDDARLIVAAHRRLKQRVARDDAYWQTARTVVGPGVSAGPLLVHEKLP